MFEAHFDGVRRRLSIRYSGFWTDQDCAIALDRFRREIASAGAGGTFSLLEDFRDFAVQPASVMEASRHFVEIVDRAPISRDALIASSALLRAQLRRQPGSSAVVHGIFATLAEADHWLAEVERRPHAA